MGRTQRQLQYIGKLMRDIDPAPIRGALDAWAQGHDIDTARQHALERWRERLLARAGRARRVRRRVSATRSAATARARRARAAQSASRGAPPHAFRELFRALKALATRAS